MRQLISVSEISGFVEHVKHGRFDLRIGAVKL